MSVELSTCCLECPQIDDLASAQARIAELEAEVERLRGALRPFAEHARQGPYAGVTMHPDTLVGVRWELMLTADVALTPQPTPAKEDSGACGACGEKMTGEWMDGSELTCPECGAEVTAVAMTDNTWSFPVAATEEDDDE